MLELTLACARSFELPFVQSHSLVFRNCVVHGPHSTEDVPVRLCMCCGKF